MKHQGKAKKKVSKKKSPIQSDFLSWYEIPVLDLERAISFYSEIFEIQFETIVTNSHTMAFFPNATGIGGALVLGDGCVPSHVGPLLYLNVGKDLDEPLGKVHSSGGQVLMGKTLINDDMGFYSLILDSEGNRLALHGKN